MPLFVVLFPFLFYLFFFFVRFCESTFCQIRNFWNFPSYVLFLFCFVFLHRHRKILHNSSFFSVYHQKIYQSAKWLNAHLKCIFQLYKSIITYWIDVLVLNLVITVPKTSKQKLLKLSSCGTCCDENPKYSSTLVETKFPLDIIRKTKNGSDIQSSYKLHRL